MWTITENEINMINEVELTVDEMILIKESLGYYFSTRDLYNPKRFEAEKLQKRFINLIKGS